VASPGDLRPAGLEGDPRDLARAVCERGPHTAFVTRGEAGALAAATDRAPWPGGASEASHDGYDVDPVDTTGAGDAFTAGAISALREGAPLSEALDVATAVAALTTTAAGGMAAMPDRTAVEAVRETPP
jgi:fructokinase